MAWKLLEPAILPFYALAGLYLFSISTSGLLSTNPVILVLLKIVPIWYLLAYTRFSKPKPISPKAKRKLTNEKPSSSSDSVGVEKSYKNFVSLGLAISSIGDVFMTEQSALIAGGAVFGVAHVLYVFAFRKRGTRAKYAYIVLPLAPISLYTIGSRVLHSNILLLFVCLYNVMISATVISALCCHENNWKSTTLFAAVGASLFGISDYVIAFDLFVTSFPHAQLVIMVTYYTAQLFIALSVN